jgi:hypothetical protein
MPAKSGSGGGERGDSIKFELNQVDGNINSAILCWHGSEYSTSNAEALWTSRWSSMAPCYQVVHPRWLQFIARREPVSIQLLFFSGNTLEATGERLQ